MARRRENQRKPLPDAALVVRGGHNTRANLRNQATRYADTHDGICAVSVFSIAGATAAEIARVAQFGYPVMKVSDVGKIREAGFDVVPGGRYGHGHVTFPDLTNETLDRFRKAFGPEQPNPAAPEI